MQYYADLAAPLLSVAYNAGVSFSDKAINSDNIPLSEQIKIVIQLLTQLSGIPNFADDAEKRRAMRNNTLLNNLNSLSDKVSDIAERIINNYHIQNNDVVRESVLKSDNEWISGELQNPEKDAIDGVFIGNSLIDDNWVYIYRLLPDGFTLGWIRLIKA